MKNYLLTIVLIGSGLLLGCEKETEDVKSSSSALAFDSLDDLEKELGRVVAIQKQQEESLREVILDYSSNREQGVIETLALYHNERLKLIRNRQNEHNFKGIQNIADELNSLRVVDPIQYNELFEEYRDFLISNEFGVLTVFDKDLGYLISTDGELFVNGDNVAVANAIPQKALIVGAADIVAQTTPSGVYNQYEFVVTFAAGVNQVKEHLFKRSEVFTALHSYLKFSNQYYQYPCWFVVHAGSYARFAGHNYCFPVTVPFQSGSYVTSTHASVELKNNCENFYSKTLVPTGVIGGTFSTLINGQPLVMSGTQTF